MKEIWKDIAGYKGLYQISNLGRVKSLAKKINNHYLKEKILKNWFNSDKTRKRYYRISLVKNNRKHKFLVHRLIAKAFIPGLKNKKEVNHKDGVTTNNKISNLEWMTKLENMKHARDNGFFVNIKYGEDHPLSKLKSKDIKFIRKSELKRSELAYMFKVCQTTIANVLTNKIWKNI